MKVLFIGGTGTISAAITRHLLQTNCELYLLNRGNRNVILPSDVHCLTCDVNDESAVKKLLDGHTFDAVCDFIGFLPSHVERDYRLFRGKTEQYIFISSASAYQKPLSHFCITEGTGLSNPYWQYSRDKIACEEFLYDKYRKEGFPVTIVRPSHTYDERSIPLGVHGKNGSWQVAKRMLMGKPVIIHGDGTSLWTMTHNSDFAKGFVGLLGNPHAIGQAFQITSDETLTWNQIYQSIAKSLHVELKPYYVSSQFLSEVSDYDFTGSLIGDKSNSVVFDNSKLKSVVPGFCATKRFDQGVKETIDNIMKNPDLQRLDPEFDAWCDRVIDGMESLKINLNKR